VLLAMAQPVINHRRARLPARVRGVQARLQRLFQTECPVLIFAASGTGAMDASVSNLLSPGDHALVINGGKFGERWQEICEAYGVRTTTIDVAWGKAVDPAAVAAALDAHPDIKAVFVQASETSTGGAPPDARRSRRSCGAPTTACSWSTRSRRSASTTCRWTSGASTS
jgi:aspartate aminotransferase-like enzyme